MDTNWIQHLAKMLMRSPSEGEKMYYMMNPKTAGMATEDGRIAMNPYSPNTPQQQDSVAQNEMFRLFFRNNAVPQFPLNLNQQNAFGGYGSQEDIRSTILARIMSGDQSAMSNPMQNRLAVEQLLKFRRGW